MRTLIVLLLVAALQFAAVVCDDCSDKRICPPDAPEVCVLHSELYCFTRYENLCVWNEVKCKYNLDFQIYALPYCDLENFECPQTKGKQQE